MGTVAKNFLLALLTGATLWQASAGFAMAETVLRLDEIAVGELDPGKASDYADSILMFNVYDTLVIPNQGKRGYQTHLAESWTANGQSYTFRLRGDVKFQSGNPLTAEDVVFSLERMKALGQGLSYLFDAVECVEAIDTQTVKFILSRPNAPFIAALVRLPIIDRKLVMANLGTGSEPMKDWGQAFLSAKGAGSGAYRFLSHNPQQETVLAKNPDYFLAVAAVAPDTVRLRYGLEPSTVRTLIAQGEHDISSQWVPPEVLRSLAANGAQLLSETGTSEFYMKMNTAKPPLDDVNCRLALSYAFDYRAMASMLTITPDVAQGRASTGAIPVGLPGSNPANQTFKRDLEIARNYLSRCKYKPEDFTLELSWIGEIAQEERFALMMQANFAEIGIRSKIVKLPWALFTEQVSKPQNAPNISQVFLNAVTGDPDTLVYNMYHSAASGTFQSAEYLKDAKVDDLLEKGRTSLDETQRATVYSALNRRVVDLAPDIFAYDQTAVFAASNRVSVPA